MVDGKTTETANLNSVTAHQCIIHSIKNRLDCKFSITVSQLAKARSQLFDKIRTRHYGVPSTKILSRNESAPSAFAIGAVSGCQINSGIRTRFYFSLLSSLARNKAPKLVVPAFSRADCWLSEVMASF